MLNNTRGCFRGSMLFVLIGTLSVVGAWPLWAAGAEVGSEQQAAESVAVLRSELFDRLYGGWVGTLIGGLEGLPHEFKYIDEPRAVAFSRGGCLPNGCSDCMVQPDGHDRNRTLAREMTVQVG